MSKIRTVAMGAVFTLGFAVLAGAQVPAKPDSAGRGMRDGGPRRGMMDGQGRGGMHGRRGGFDRRGFDRGRGQGRLIADLKLTDAQKARIKTIHEKHRSQFRQGATAIRTQERNDVRAVLTAEQRAKWDAAAAQRKQRLEGRREKMKQRRGDRARIKA